MYPTNSAAVAQIMHDGGEQVVGIVFPSVAIPPSAYITEARVIFDIDEVRPGQSDGSVTINIFGESNANAAAPTDTAQDLSNRAPTAAAVTWVPEPSANTHDELVTPDIRSVVQEIVDLPGWTPGNSMGIMFGHVTGSGVRWVEAFRNNNGIDTPAITVSYYASDLRNDAVSELYSVTGRPDSGEEDVPGGAMYLTSSDLEIMHDGGEQVVAVVFPSVNVPAGATVTAANVIFDVDEVRPGQSDGSVTVAIYGQVGPADAPSDTAFDLSSRTATDASVIWQPEASVNTHDDLITPDISTVVNEIVNGGSWVSGSGMGIMFGHMTGSGVRWVEAFRNNNGIDTPALSVSYLSLTSATLTPPAFVTDGAAHFMTNLGSNDAHISVFGSDMQQLLPVQDLTVEMWTKWVAGGSDWAGPIAASQDDGGTERGWNIQTRCKDPSSGSTVNCAESRRIEFSLSTEKTDDGDGAMAYLGYPDNAARCTFASGAPIFADLTGSWHHYAWSYDGTSMKAYVDGTLAQQDDVTAAGAIVYPPSGYESAQGGWFTIGAYHDTNGKRSSSRRVFLRRLTQAAAQSTSRSPAPSTR